MTAQAMKGMRERCLSVGMDDYLVKPVRAREIYDKIETLFAGRQPTAPVSAASAVASAEIAAPTPAADPLPELQPVGTAAIDWDSAIAVVDGDRELLREVVEAFLMSVPTLWEEIRQALAAGDANRFKRGAHTLKGALRTLGLEMAAQLASELEEIGRSGDLCAAPRSWRGWNRNSIKSFPRPNPLPARARHARTEGQSEDFRIECRVFCRGSLALLEPHGAHSDRPRSQVAKRRSLGHDLIAATQRKQPNGNPARSR